MGLVLQYEDIFALDDSELGLAEGVSHVIDTGGEKPIKQYPRHVPFSLRGKVEEMIKKMEEQGVIQPSHSPWASPIVLVAKKDGSTRFCVDYRKLNAITRMDVYPLPRIDDMLDLLANNQYFSTLDLASGYWQVKMDQSSQEKTAFTTQVGLYEFRVMPFDLCNAPATFQRLMEKVLHGLVGKICLVYLDDVLVLGKSMEEHLDNLKQVWERLREAQLRLKPSKCQLVMKEVEYLWFVVSSEGITTSPAKVLAVKNFPVPSDVTSVRSFLSLASYYWRFIPNFSVIAGPLFDSTKKDAPFQWSEDCQHAFQCLKDALSGSTVLALPDFDKPFVLETDASGRGLGAVLSQEQSDGRNCPVAYASHTLQKHEQNYGIKELEGLAVVWADKHFRHYLYGHRCHIYTDHEALKALLNTLHPSGKLARWGLILQELDVVIHYQPGRKNMKADALSRNPMEPLGDENEEEDHHVVATIEKEPTQPRETAASTLTLGDRQRNDLQLQPFILFQEMGCLPDDPVQATSICASQFQFTLIEGVLYHVN